MTATLSHTINRIAGRRFVVPPAGLFTIWRNLEMHNHQRKDLDAASIQANQNIKTFSSAFDAYAYNTSRRKIQQKNFVVKPRKYQSITSIPFLGMKKTTGRRFEVNPRLAAKAWDAKIEAHRNAAGNIGARHG
jgi:hypothetical protein